LRELGIGADALAPPFHASRRLEPGDRGDQVGAREPVRRRERDAGLVVRRLLGDGRAAEGAADDYAAKGARPAAELAFHDGTIIHRLRR
jgi:hypothetical protein